MMRRWAFSYPILLGLLGSCLPLVGQSVDRQAVAEYSDKGQQALAAGRYREAEEDFLALEKMEPEVAEVHASLALIYFQERRYQDAVPEIREARKLKPALTRLDSLLAMSLSEMGNYQEALPELQKVFHQSSDPAIKRMSGLQLMRAYTGLKQEDQAVEVALALNKLYPKDPEVLYNTGKVYGNLAFLTIQQLAQRAPDSLWRHLAAAEAYESQGSSLEAIREYRAVLTIDPRRPGVHYRIGRTLLSQSHRDGAATDVDEARKEYQQELDMYPRNGNAAYEIAEIYRRAGQFELAQQFFERAISEYPNFGEAQDGLGAVLIAENKPEQALPHLKAALAINPDDEVSWYRLSQLERSTGDRSGQQDALTHFQLLHQRSIDQQSTGLAGSSSEITKQEVDAPAPQ